MSVKESVEKRVKSKIEIPDGWGIKKLKQIAKNIQYGYTTSSKQDKVGPKFLRITDIQNGNVDWNSVPYCECNDGDSKKYQLKTGDIVFARTGATTGKSYIIKSPPDSIFASYLIKVRINDDYSKEFIHFFFQTNDYWKQIKSNVAGSTQGGVNATKLSNLRILAPNSLEEQQKIADILSKVDEQINFTEQIIDKTEELKKGLMRKLLTKGIGHTKFKKTEFGEIPEEWENKRLDGITEIIVSNVDKKVNETEEPVQLCNYKDVYDNDYICSKLNFMKGTANKAEINRFSLNKDDVIITKDSETKFDIAVPSVVIEDLNNVVCGYHLAILRPKSNLLDGLYLMNVLKTRSINNHFVKFAQGLTRFGLTIDAINRAKMPLPPLNEQKQIASILSKVDEQIQDNKKELKHLRELKKGLMQDLLTGKVRVTT